MPYLVRIFLLSILFTVISPTLSAESMARSPSVDGAQAYIVSPGNGDIVDQTFTVVFGLKGMGVAPAGTAKKHTGHHHLIIDGDKLPAMDIPMGSNVKHFGGGQTETTVTLDPGTHTLQLILGDQNHVPHNPPVVSEKISITVK